MAGSARTNHRPFLARHQAFKHRPPAPLSASPEVLKPSRTQLGVSDRMLDVLMTQVRLQGASVMPPVRQCVPAGVTQHVGVNDEVEACAFANPLNQPIDCTGCRAQSRTRKPRSCCAGVRAGRGVHRQGSDVLQAYPSSPYGHAALDCGPIQPVTIPAPRFHWHVIHAGRRLGSTLRHAVHSDRSWRL